MFIFNAQGNFTTVFLPKPHSNPGIMHAWCPHCRSTERQGEMVTLQDHTVTGRQLQI